jgi:hypothetical protein
MYHYICVLILRIVRILPFRILLYIIVPHSPAYARSRSWTERTTIYVSSYYVLSAFYSILLSLTLLYTQAAGPG